MTANYLTVLVPFDRRESGGDNAEEVPTTANGRHAKQAPVRTPEPVG